MKNVSAIGKYLVLVHPLLLSAVIQTTGHAQTTHPDESAQKPRDQRQNLTQPERDAILVDIPKILDLTKAIYNAVPLTSSGSPSSPLMVRGGAMTFRTTDVNGWQPTGSITLPLCVNVDTRFINFNQVVPVAPTSAPFTPTGLSYITSAWTMAIYGRVPGGGKDSVNGILFTAQPNTICSTDSSGTARSSVKMSALSGNSGLYPIDSLSDDKTDNRRFYDNTPATGGSPGCIGANADEDSCERIFRIVLTVPTATPTVYNYKCFNGDCSIGIGQK